MAQPSQNASDLAVLSFSQPDLHFRHASLGFEHASPIDPHKTFGNIDALTHFLHRFAVDLASNRDSINLLNGELRVCQFLSQITIIGQQDQSFTAQVETTNRKHTFTGRDQINNPRSTARISIGGDDTGGFVDGVIHESLLPQNRVIDANGLLLGIDTDAQFLDHRAINADAPFADQLFDMTTAAIAR